MVKRSLATLLILLSAPFSRAEETGPDLSKVPPHLIQRCTSENRLAQIQKFGGDPKSEKAVIDALRFLKNTQNEDGSWVTGQKVGMTGLALLTFLGHGETAQSEEFGETVLTAMYYLVDISQKNNGKLAADFKGDHWCYEHAIAVYALAEAYLLCVKSFGENIEGLKDAVQTAGQFMINSQHKDGGWDYAYSKDSVRGGDVSITTWHMLALKALKDTGLDFKNLEKSSRLGLDYIERMQLPSGAIGYLEPQLISGQDGTTLAAAGGLCFQIWKSSSTKVARKACTFIDREMKFAWDTADSDLYGHFFASRAMFQSGGEAWNRHQAKVFSEILQNQAPNGSFLPVATKADGKINAVAPAFLGDKPFATHYRTCLAALILEVYYRHPQVSTANNR